MSSWLVTPYNPLYYILPAPSQDGSTALMYASKDDNLEIVNLLITAMADLDAATSTVSVLWILLWTSTDDISASVCGYLFESWDKCILKLTLLTLYPSNML